MFLIPFGGWGLGCLLIVCPQDGPYLADENSSGDKNFKLPAGSPSAKFMLKNVKGEPGFGV